ncbi:MAG: aminotransferase [Bacteroidota bacterium]|nr:MAG: aminotransferase [Bacteroidota bacterium]
MANALIEPIINLRVSEMAENLVGSEIIKLAGEVKEKIAKGEKIYNMTIGDFDPKIFPIPNELQNEITNAYLNGETNYPPADGIKELREVVSRFLHTRQTLEYNENQILIAGGARPLIYSLYQTLLNPDDVVLFPVPSWNNNHYTHLSHAKQIFIETKAEDNFMPTAQQLQPYISSATLISLCSPLNPSGTTFGKEQLFKICDLIMDENKKRAASHKKPLYLMYDQIYWTLTYGETVHVDPVSLFPEMKNFTIFIDGISKTLAATGVRVGWAFGPQKIIDKMKSILGHIGAWAPKAEQVACAKYLKNDKWVDTYLENFKAQLNNRLTSFYNGFIHLKNEGFKVNAIAPQAAIYLTIQFNLFGLKTETGKEIKTTEDITSYILNEAKLAVVPFSAFGSTKNSTWYRLSVGTASTEDVEDIINNLRKALSKLS